MQPEQANSIGSIIDKIQSGSDRPSHITNVIVINGPANIEFEMEHPVTSEMRTLMGMTLPPPADIVPGTAYIFNGNFYVSNETYNMTDIIIAVRGEAYWDGGALRNIAPCDGTGRNKLGFYTTGDLYFRDVATGVDLIAGRDVIIGENFNEFEPGPHDVSMQASRDIWTDESGQNIACPSSTRSYTSAGSTSDLLLVD